MKSKSKSGEQYMKLFEWRENPFNFKILPELFVGYSNELNNISGVLENKEKFSLLIGPTGSGKTTLLRHMSRKFTKKYMIYYLPKPPKDPTDLIGIFTKYLGGGIFDKMFSREKNITLYNLSEWINKKLNENELFIFFDESHEASIETLEWLRTIVDQVDGLSVILSGLPVLDSLLKEQLETFTCRINTKIELTNLTRSETREMIKKRIEWVGGDDIKPFTSEAIDHVYDMTGGFPREVIRVCNGLVKKALEKNISTIDVNFLNEVESGSVKRVSLNSLDGIPVRQRSILELLSGRGSMTPNEIVANMDLSEYKDKHNAVRSVNNILKRLLKDEFLTRKGKGKSYQYMVSEKIKTLLVNK